MDYFKLSRKQAAAVCDVISKLHFVKAKICGTPLDESVYALAGDLYEFVGRTPPFTLKAYLPKKKPRILTADKMFRWLEENRYKPSEFVHGLVCSPDDRVDFYQGMWPLCGGTDTGGYTWLPEWFEKEEEER